MSNSERIEFMIDGWPPSMKNSRQIVTNRRTGRPMVIKSKKARDWLKVAILQVPSEYRGLGWGSASVPLSVTLHIWYENRRPDLDGELVLDLLQDAGVISNDRHVYEKHYYKHFSKTRPLVQVIVEKIIHQTHFAGTPTETP